MGGGLTPRVLPPKTSHTTHTHTHTHTHTCNPHTSQTHHTHSLQTVHSQNNKRTRPLPQAIGSPGEEDIQFVSSEKARRYLRSLPRCPRADFQELWPQADPQVRGAWEAPSCPLTWSIGHAPPLSCRLGASGEGGWGSSKVITRTYTIHPRMHDQTLRWPPQHTHTHTHTRSHTKSPTQTHTQSKPCSQHPQHACMNACTPPPSPHSPDSPTSPPLPPGP
jgi:hypothetical protein